MSSTITSNMEDYLERIYLLIQEHRVARVKDIATSRGVKNPSVNNAIIELKKRGYVIQEPYGYVLLTKEGEVEAERILKRHKLLREFLLHLGVSEEVADEDACCMEHFLNDETLKAIDVFCKKQTKAKSKS